MAGEEAKVITEFDCKFYLKGCICTQTERTVCGEKACKMTLEGDSDG